MKIRKGKVVKGDISSREREGEVPNDANSSINSDINFARSDGFIKMTSKHLTV